MVSTLEGSTRVQSRAAARGALAVVVRTVGLHHPLPNVSGPLPIRGDAVLALPTRAGSFGVEPGEEERWGREGAHVIRSEKERFSN